MVGVLNADSIREITAVNGRIIYFSKRSAEKTS